MRKISIILFFILSFKGFSHSLRYYPDAPLRIITIGHPTLSLVAEPVEELEINESDFQEFISNMITRMKKAGGVGLAAPQVDVSKRIFVMKPSFLKKTEVIINPKVEYLEEKGTKISSEGCLSIPGRSFKVERYKQLRVSYLNRRGEEVFEKIRGFRAIVFQHEYDHLEGILISDPFSNNIFEISDDLNFQAPLM